MNILHKPYIYYSITTLWGIYCSITQLFIIFIAFAQLDLLVVRLVSDLLANMVTTSIYLQEKVFNPEHAAEEAEGTPLVVPI